MGVFTVQLQQFATKSAAKADTVVKASVIEASRRLDNRSPVGDASFWKNPPPKGYTGGRFRGNWQLGIGVVPSGETGAIDKSGAETQGRIIAQVPANAAGEVYFIINNVPYAQALEEGHSRQAPSGMVGLTVIEWPGIVDQAAKGLAA